MFLLLPGRVGSSSSRLGLSEHHPGCEGQGCSFSPHVASTDTEVGGVVLSVLSSSKSLSFPLCLLGHHPCEDRARGTCNLRMADKSRLPGCSAPTPGGQTCYYRSHLSTWPVPTNPPPPPPGVRGSSISLQSGGGESRALHLAFAGSSGGGAQFFP